MILSRLFSRNSENPSHPISDLDDLATYPSATGDAVSHAAALQLPPFYRALDLISADIAKLPLDVFIREPAGKRRATKHPAYTLLRYNASSDLTAYGWKRAMAYQALFGNAYSLIERSETGRVTGLLLLDSKRVTPTRQKGELWYVYQTDTGEQLRWTAEEILHWRGMSWDGMVGHSALEVMREAIGAGLAVRKYGAKYFHNSARPSMVLEHPGSFRNREIADRLRKSWESIHRGLNSSHRIAILEEGMKASTISANAKDAQLVEAANFNLVDVALFFGIPPHKLGAPGRTSYASLEQENQAYLDQCLDPWLVQIEQECRTKLLTEKQKTADSHLIEFNREALVRADLSTKAAAINLALSGAPWMTVNEARGLFNMSQLPAEFDALILPTNNFGDPTATPPAEEPTPAPAEDVSRNAIIASAERILANETRRMIRRVAGSARRASKKRKALALFLDNYQADHRAVIEDTLRPICALMQAAGAADVNHHDEVAKILERFAILADALDDPGDDIADRVEAKLETIEAE